ncbi:hypothetical protein J3A83DRAFT_4195539 [Scleroderma citrinum]
MIRHATRGKPLSDESKCCVKEEHVKMLQGLVLGSPDCPSTDFNSSPQNEACLVTPRHTVQTMWNESALRRHCQETDNSIKGWKLNHMEQQALANQSAQRQAALGVGINTQGTIVNIFLHSEESYSTMEGGVILTFLPLFILAKLDCTRTSALEGLDEEVILVEPSTKFMQIDVQDNKGQEQKRSVRQQQFPITAAYTFMDHQSQGQTLQHIIINIANLPTGGLSLFNLYVTLSQGRG